MKKLCRMLVIFFVLIICITCFFGCNKKTKPQEYFNNFASRGAFASAKPVLSLPENVSIFSYDSKNDLFFTKTQVINQYGSSQDETMILLGIASTTEVYCSPRYTSILKIKGDYAVVTKPAIGKDSEDNNVVVYNVGVVKFRNTGNKNTLDLTDFSVEHNPNYDQFNFVGDYIVCPGIKEAPLGTLFFSTFYDYSQDRLLEAFRIKCGTDYAFTINDGLLSAVGGNHAYFFELKNLQINGYLELNEKDFYYAFPEDENEEYKSQISIDIFYLGNGWYSRTAKIKSEEIFVGYNMILQEYDTYSGETTTYYANVRCDLYNVKTKTATQKEWLIVENVANEYNDDYYIELCSYLQNITTFDNSTGRYPYKLPYLNPAMSVKNGYSIVYYYYLPYVDSDNYQAEISFCLMDKQGNIIRVEDLLLPPVFVDEWAVQTADPMYQNYFGSCSLYDNKFKEKVLAPFVEDTYTYITYTYNDGGVVANQLNLQNKQSFYGALAVSGKQILPFVYEELSLYFGEFCIGTKKEGNAYLTYRIDRSGNATLLSDVVNVRQGVYVFSDSGRLGLKNYEGQVLIQAKYDSLDVVETIMGKGNLLSSYVVAGLGKNTIIFSVE